MTNLRKCCHMSDVVCWFWENTLSNTMSRVVLTVVDCTLSPLISKEPTGWYNCSIRPPSADRLSVCGYCSACCLPYSVPFHPSPAGPHTVCLNQRWNVGRKVPEVEMLYKTVWWPRKGHLTVYGFWYILDLLNLFLLCLKIVNKCGKEFSFVGYIGVGIWCDVSVTACRV